MSSCSCVADQPRSPATATSAAWLVYGASASVGSSERWSLPMMSLEPWKPHRQELFSCAVVFVT